uniref:Uncharacterized protein n=1 Tax=Arundo donax TaxID=35708 RepID=A0A0A9FZZ9_ARUDO
MIQWFVLIKIIQYHIKPSYLHLSLLQNA